MARYTDADCKRCRREKMKLFLKGAKCESPKCPFEKRPYPPGQHGRGLLGHGPGPGLIHGDIGFELAVPRLDACAPAQATLADTRGRDALATQRHLHLVLSSGARLALHCLAMPVLTFPFEDEFSDPGGGGAGLCAPAERGAPGHQAGEYHV